MHFFCLIEIFSIQHFCLFFLNICIVRRQESLRILQHKAMSYFNITIFTLRKEIDNITPKADNANKRDYTNRQNLTTQQENSSAAWCSGVYIQ